MEDASSFDAAIHWREHLEWSAKQGRVLTDNGKALQHYSAENGFPFAPEELPHHYMSIGRDISCSVFKKWAKDRRALSGEQGGIKTPPQLVLSNGARASVLQPSPIVGAWDRPLFAGTWEHSTNEQETVYNVQTGTLFVDLRIPRSKPTDKWEKQGRQFKNPRRALESMSDLELRLFARQHVFGGFSLLTTEKDGRPLCTRHHAIDWNYVEGKPRPRPNKWYIEPKGGNSPANVWKEWSYSGDEYGQCYYYERWQRISGDENGEGLTLAMRKKSGQDDGILVVVGDHFNYILGRQWSGKETKYPEANSAVELIDSAIENGDRETAISYLSLDGGHGTVSSGWKIDCSIHPWNHGLSVFERIGCGNIGRGNVRVVGEGPDFFAWEVMIGDTAWEIYELSPTIDSAAALEELLTGRSQSRL
ncbi:hypothetical protein ACHAXT_006230 [Thalassiosira profunda]